MGLWVWGSVGLWSGGSVGLRGLWGLWGARKEGNRHEKGSKTAETESAGPKGAFRRFSEVPSTTASTVFHGFGYLLDPRKPSGHRIGAPRARWDPQKELLGATGDIGESQYVQKYKCFLVFAILGAVRVGFGSILGAFSSNFGTHFGYD